MICTNCGHTVTDGTFFCTNCGAALSDGLLDGAAKAGETSPQELGASLEAAVQANKEVIDSIESRAQAQVDAAFGDFPPMEEAGASADAAAADAASADAASAGAASADAAGQASPEAPAGFAPEQQGAASQPGAQGYAASAGVAAAAAASTPFYQNDASPNAHFSSQRSYDQNPYGETVGQQPGYQQPSYGQPRYAQPQQQPWGIPSATERCLAMVLYIAGFIGMIIGLCVRDKDDPFMTHHLNNVLVIFIGSIISGMLMIVGIGFLLLLYLFVMTIMGMVSAYNGNMDELPLIGKIRLLN